MRLRLGRCANVCRRSTECAANVQAKPSERGQGLVACPIFFLWPAQTARACFDMYQQEAACISKLINSGPTYIVHRPTGTIAINGRARARGRAWLLVGAGGACVKSACTNISPSQCGLLAARDKECRSTEYGRPSHSMLCLCVHIHLPL